MILEILCCCKTLNESDDKLKYIIVGAAVGTVGSLLVSLLLFFANKDKEKQVREDTKRQEIKNEMYIVCGKLIRYAIEAEHANFTYWHAFYQKERNIKLDKKDNIREDNFYCETFLIKSDQTYSAFKMHRVDLQKVFFELRMYWENKSDIDKIEKLIIAAMHGGIRNGRNLFSDKDKTSEELTELYNKAVAGIADSVQGEGVGVPLLEIQKIVEPNAHFWFWKK